MNIAVNNQSELRQAAHRLLDFANGCRIMLFYGEVGAGKTTFIKEICKQLGSSDNFSSPTYAIVNEYNSTSGKIYHFDLYRLDTTTALMDIGIEDYLYSGNYCFFEWPDLVESLLHKNYVSVAIKASGNIRYIRASK